jgi:hypothetical protein
MGPQRIGLPVVNWVLAKFHVHCQMSFLMTPNIINEYMTHIPMDSEIHGRSHRL